MPNRISSPLEFPADASLPNQTDPAGRILIVDDDTCRCELNAETLRRHGYSVTIAGDSEAGWEELQNNRYNLLITEHDLPGLTGAGLVRKLRSACMSLPVIMVVETLPSWRSADYPWFLKAAKLFKPYSFGELLESVKRILPPASNLRARITPAYPEGRPSTFGLDHNDLAPRFLARL
jgi:DNA-binding response OmpR family regulator